MCEYSRCRTLNNKQHRWEEIICVCYSNTGWLMMAFAFPPGVWEKMQLTCGLRGGFRTHLCCLTSLLTLYRHPTFAANNNTANFRTMTPVDCSVWVDEIAAGHSKSLAWVHRVYRIHKSAYGNSSLESLFRVKMLFIFFELWELHPCLSAAVFVVRWSLMKGKK